MAKIDHKNIRPSPFLIKKCRFINKQSILFQRVCVLLLHITNKSKVQKKMSNDINIQIEYYNKVHSTFADLAFIGKYDKSSCCI